MEKEEEGGGMFHRSVELNQGALEVEEGYRTWEEVEGRLGEEVGFV